jgi:hypothetical protein
MTVVEITAWSPGSTNNLAARFMRRVRSEQLAIIMIDERLRRRFSVTLKLSE